MTDEQNNREDHKQLFERIENAEKKQILCRSELDLSLQGTNNAIDRVAEQVSRNTANVEKLTAQIDRVAELHEEVVNGFGKIKIDHRALTNKSDEAQLNAACAVEMAQRNYNSISPLLTERENAEKARQEAVKNWRVWSRKKAQKIIELIILTCFVAIVGALMGVPAVKLVLAFWGK